MVEKPAFRWLACWQASKAEAGRGVPWDFALVRRVKRLGCPAVELITHLLFHCVQSESVCEKFCEVAGGVWGRVVPYMVQFSALNLAIMRDKSLQSNKNIIS